MLEHNFDNYEIDNSINNLITNIISLQIEEKFIEENVTIIIENIITSLENDLSNQSEDKKEIIQKFYNNVKGKSIPAKINCGDEGHWLEKQMGLKPNSKNEPDINGYEMKKESNKITFGDFSASKYLFNIHDDFTRDEFIKTFGTQKDKKKGQKTIKRYSWSGECVPKYANGSWNQCGQKMIIDENENLCIYYSYQKDERTIKEKFKEFLKTENEILIAFWEKEKLSNHINRKFNKNGFFICKKDENKETYQKICFGKKFSFNDFISGLKNEKIFFDSGMYMGNTRNYSQFRADKNFWNSLIVQEF